MGILVPATEFQKKPQKSLKLFHAELQAYLGSLTEEKWDSIQRQGKPLAAGRRQMEQTGQDQKTQSQMKGSQKENGSRGTWLRIKKTDGGLEAEKHIPENASFLPEVWRKRCHRQDLFVSSRFSNSKHLLELDETFTNLAAVWGQLSEGLVCVPLHIFPAQGLSQKWALTSVLLPMTMCSGCLGWIQDLSATKGTPSASASRVLSLRILSMHPVPLLCTPSSEQSDTLKNYCMPQSRAASMTQTPPAPLPCPSLPRYRSHPCKCARCHKQPLQEAAGGMGLPFLSWWSSILFLELDRSPRTKHLAQ